MDDDRKQLNLLSIFHYVVAGLTALISCFPLIHLLIGVLIVTGAFDEADGDFPTVFGWIFIIFPACFILCGWTLAIFIAVAGRKLARYKSWTVCLVIAAIECIFIPLGTILGVFTIVVLMRDSVKELFDSSDRL